jgi:hypothetical protein
LAFLWQSKAGAQANGLRDVAGLLSDCQDAIADIPVFENLGLETGSIWNA